jgi:hypothetical protein
MRLFRFQGGRFRHLPLPQTSAVMQHVDVETLIRQNIHTDGSISSLCLDFCGSYITLQHEDEIRLAARLLCTYHNSLLPRGPHQSPCDDWSVGPATDAVTCPVDILGDNKDTRDNQHIERTEEGQWECPRGPRAPRDKHAPRVLYAPPSFARASADTSVQKLKQRWQRLAAMTPAVNSHPATAGFDENAYNDAGLSDSDDEKENNRRLEWDFEINADIDGAPCFGKAKMENRLW